MKKLKGLKAKAEGMTRRKRRKNLGSIPSQHQPRARRGFTTIPVTQRYGGNEAVDGGYCRLTLRLQLNREDAIRACTGDETTFGGGPAPPSVFRMQKLAQLRASSQLATTAIVPIVDWHDKHWGLTDLSTQRVGRLLSPV